MNKRFTIKRIYTDWFDRGFGYQIYDNEASHSIGESSEFESDLEDFCNLLNELYEENQHLREQIKTEEEYVKEMEALANKIGERVRNLQELGNLKEENERLKEQLERLAKP